VAEIPMFIVFRWEKVELEVAKISMFII